MFDAIFALAILTSDGPVSDAEIRLFRPAIPAVAEAAEISDPRERYILASPQEGLETLRSRWVAFHDTPRIHEASRFPDRHFISEHLAINRHRRGWLVKLGEINSLWREQAAGEIEALDFEYEIWDNARDAQQDAYWIATRRQALANLRRLIGDIAFYSGRLP